MQRETSTGTAELKEISIGSISKESDWDRTQNQRYCDLIPDTVSVPLFMMKSDNNQARSANILAIVFINEMFLNYFSTTYFLGRSWLGTPSQKQGFLNY